MIDAETVILDELERLAPLDGSERADWLDVLRRAEIAPSPAQRRTDRAPAGGRRFAWSRRTTIVALLACLVLAIPLIAFGTNGWWYQHPHQFPSLEPKPISGEPGIIATGQREGAKWTAIGYISKQLGFMRVNGKLKPNGGTMVCMTTITGSLSNQPNGQGCGGLYGMKGVVATEGAWTTYINQSSSPSLVVGATAAKVARLVAVLNPYPYPNGKVRTTNVPLISVKQVGGGIHFYVFTYPQTVGVSALLLYDASGHLLKRLAWG